MSKLFTRYTLFMLDTLITSKTRIKLLMKFFLNPETSSYLRELSSEFNESTNSVRVELNRLKDAGLLQSARSGRLIKYKANLKHNLFDELSALVKKYMGVDQIIDQLVGRLGDVHSAYIIGDYAKGIDSGLIDIVLVGNIDKTILNQISEKRGLDLQKKIRSIVLKKEEIIRLWDSLDRDSSFLIWGQPISKD